MIHDLKPYPSYKESGEPWLGHVPEHWEVRRTKTILRERSQKGFPDEPLLAATQTKGVVRKDQYENRTVLAVKDLHLLKLVRVGDFVVSLRSFQGGIEYAREQGIISPAYTVLYPTDSAIHGYLTWLFKSKPYIENLTLNVTGIRQGQNIDYERLSRSRIAVPRPDEQAAIPRFLGHADRLIRHYILEKRRLVRLLNEEKQAMIHRVVTRGLDPNVRLKSSKIDWLGGVPEHWEVTQLRRYWRVVDCKHLTVPFVDEGVPLASVREVQSFDLDLTSANRTTDDWYQLLVSGGRQPRYGDLIYCRNVSVGSCAFVSTSDVFAMGQDVCMIRSDKQNQRYLNYLFHSRFMQQQLSQLLVGSTFNRINVAEIKSLGVLVPPRAEQDSIATHLDSALAEVDLPIDRIKREIQLIHEYRSRLIADVVTGKVDVREAAAELPDETEEPLAGSELGVPVRSEDAGHALEPFKSEARA